MLEKKVAILRHNTDAEVLTKRILEPLGYKTQTFDRAVDPVPAIGDYRPDVLVMDFSPLPSCCWGVVSRLAAIPHTMRLPVVAIADSEKVVGDALIHANVAQALIAPFDGGELADKVEAAMESASLLSWLHPSVVREERMVEAARILTRNSNDIVFRWLERLVATEPFKSRPDLQLPNLLDGLPLLIMVTVSVLRFGLEPESMAEREHLWNLAKEQAVRRCEQGIPLWAVILENQYLRDAIWEWLERALPLERLTSHDAFVLGERVHYALDRLTVAMTQAYAEVGETSC